MTVRRLATLLAAQDGKSEVRLLVQNGTVRQWYVGGLVSTRAVNPAYHQSPITIWIVAGFPAPEAELFFAPPYMHLPPQEEE